MMTVRVAIPDDDEAVTEIAALATAPLRQTYRPKPAAMAVQSTAPCPRTRLVALLQERVVGTVQYSLDADRVHLVGLFVHPQFQRTGVARQLVAALTELGHRVGARCLSLHRVKETGNVGIFEKLGVLPLAEQVDPGLESDAYRQLTDVYMEKPVS